jgi:hypothetical protein
MFRKLMAPVLFATHAREHNNELPYFLASFLLVAPLVSLPLRENLFGVVYDKSKDKI